ncbi:MAG TPA: hypothetical protein VF261_00775 [Candidatus Saccharimonadales bacterium]
MSIKTKIKKEIRAFERYELQHRSAFQRFGVLVLAVLTLFSVTELGAHSAQKQLARNDIVPQPNVVLNPAEKNETVRMPVKMDDGIRAVATAGQ